MYNMIINSQGNERVYNNNNNIITVDMIILGVQNLLSIYMHAFPQYILIQTILDI